MPEAVKSVRRWFLFSFFPKYCLSSWSSKGIHKRFYGRHLSSSCLKYQVRGCLSRWESNNGVEFQVFILLCNLEQVLFLQTSVSPSLNKERYLQSVPPTPIFPVLTWHHTQLLHYYRLYSLCCTLYPCDHFVTTNLCSLMPSQVYNCLTTPETNTK